MNDKICALDGIFASLIFFVEYSPSKEVWLCETIKAIRGVGRGRGERLISARGRMSLFRGAS